MMTLLLIGCKTTNDIKPSIAASQRVEQPADCERVLKNVDISSSALKKGSDFRVLYHRARGSVKLANKTITNGRECIAGQRAAYGVGW
jgi:hypothetical protein